MGSGKTYLALASYYYLMKTKKSIDLHYSTDYTQFDNIINEVRNSDKEYNFILFDDFSYQLVHNSKDYKQFLTNLFKIRHLTGKDKLIIWFNGHYSRSISVFIRSTDYRVLTSITIPEIRQLSNDYIFSEADLWDYLSYYNKHKYVILTMFRTVSKIINVEIKSKRMKNTIEDIKRRYGIY